MLKIVAISTALALMAGAASAAPPGYGSTVVRIGGLDLSNPTDVRRLERRLDAVAFCHESALRRAPHTAGSIVHGEWDRPYSREHAVFPVAGVEHAKYWPPVARIDQAYGDRNIVCSCPPVEAFA